MFKLSDAFVDEYTEKKVPWGFPIGGGNTLGEFVFLRTYSRKKPDGTKERWHEVVRRVVEGAYTLQRDHAEHYHLPWDERKAQRSAQEMYDRIFTFKFTPPGRGLWMMGTDWVMEQRNSAPLQNCAFVSTDGNAEDLIEAMSFLMEASMLGVGVGFDLKGAGIGVPGHVGTETVLTATIPDSREGWVDSVAALMESYLYGQAPIAFDYSEIRAAGEPIRGFGGTAAGPGPLRDLHDALAGIFESAAERGKLTGIDILDIANLIGKCVVAGNVRRSAEIALGEPTAEFLDAKDIEVFPERNDWETGWGWSSNNSIVVGDHDRIDAEAIARRVAKTGEPGIVWMDRQREYGRLKDAPNHRDHRASGTNPCGEQTLESYECCNLVETYPANHESKEDYLRTLKFAYLYAKSVTLLPTHWQRTNAIMMRNRRIGCSMTGVAQFVQEHGAEVLGEWMDEGYNEIQRWDDVYSEWLCVRPSIKTTSIKPSGTVSLLAGATPGVHYPTGEHYIRRVRLSAFDPLVDALAAAGYKVEPAVTDPSTAVVELPVASVGVPREADVSVWQKAALAALAQREWADNSVSVTLTFAEDEADQLPALIGAHSASFKAVSFLPMGDPDAPPYPQMPYEERPADEIASAQAAASPMDWDRLYAGEALAPVGERYCDGAVCELPVALT